MKYHYKAKLKIHDGWINKAIYNEDYKLMATSSTDSTIKILSVKEEPVKTGNISNESDKSVQVSHKVLKTYKSHVLSVNDIVFSNIYSLIISCSEDKRIYCHDLVTNKISRTFFNNFTGINCLDVRDNIVIAGDNSNLVIYDIRSSECIENLNIGKPVNTVKLIDSKILIGTDNFFILSEDRCVDAFKINQFEINNIFIGHTKTDIKNSVPFYDIPKYDSNESQERRNEDYFENIGPENISYDSDKRDFKTYSDYKNKKILLNSKDRIIEIEKQTDYQELNYKELLSQKCDISSAIKIEKYYLFTNHSHLFYTDTLDGQFYEQNENIKQIGKINDEIKGCISNRAGEEVILYGKDLHLFFKR